MDSAVAGKSVSHHHHHHHYHRSAWQRTERRRAYGDTGIMETDWVTAGVRRYRDEGDRLGEGGCTEMDGATGSIYSGDPGIDRLSSALASHLASRLVSSHIFLLYNELYTPSFASFDLTCSFRDSVWIHAIAWNLTAW